MFWRLIQISGLMMTLWCLSNDAVADATLSLNTDVGTCYGADDPLVVTVDLADQPAPAYSFQIYIDYDPTVLDFESIVADSLFSWSLAYSVNETLGTISYGMSEPLPPQGTSDPVALATISFSVIDTPVSAANYVWFSTTNTSSVNITASPWTIYPSTSDLPLVTFEPLADAGDDQDVCTAAVQLAGSVTNAADTLWSTAGDGTFDDAGLLDAVYTAGASDQLSGSVTLTLTVDATSPCTGTAADTMDVTFLGPLVDAGIDQTICDTGDATLAGWALRASSTLWSTGGDGSFDNAGVLNAVYTPGIGDISAGSVELTLTAAATSPCTEPIADSLILTIQGSPTVAAGSDQTICDVDTATMAGTATNASAILWSSAGDGSFDDTGSLTAVYTPGTGDISAGSVDLTLTVDATLPCSGSVTDSMTLTIQGSPTVDAGTDQTICDVDTATMAGSETNAAVVLWSTSGDGSFDDTGSLTAEYTPGTSDISAGSVDLTLTVDATSPCTGSVADSMTLTIQGSPTVDAGVDQTICDIDTATMAGTATNAAVILWNTAGDGGFDDASAPAAVYTPGTNDIVTGSVVLTLTVDATSPCLGSVVDSMTLTIQGSPTVDAGGDQTICDVDTATMDGSATNESAILWSTAGDGGFDDASNPAAVYTPGSIDITTGSVVLTLTVDATSPCLGSVADNMTLAIQGSPTVEAGTDQTICDVDVAIMAGVATNAAVILWSSAGDGAFNDTSDLAAVYTPGTNDISNGSVELTLTVDSTSPCVGSVADSMALTIQGSPTVDAGIDQTICETDTAAMAGSAMNASVLLWNTDGDGSFDDPGSLSAIYTPGPSDITNGTVLLTLTVDATSPCTGAVADSMTLTIQGSPAVQAGTDQTICETDMATMAGSATNASAILWSTAGDGSFGDASSLAAVYTPGSNDVATGSVELTLTVDATSPCTGSVADNMTLTIQAGPTVAAGADQTICETDTATMNGSATNTAATLWSTAGDGSFDDPSDLAAVYTPGAGDIAAGSVELTLTVDALPPCTGSVADGMILTIQGSPTVTAGSDQSICETDTATMSGLATNASSVTWSTAGDGSFDDPSDLAAIYTPGADEIAAGGVELTLTVDAMLPCTGSVSDSMVLTIQSGPTVAAGDDQTICDIDAAVMDGSATNASAVFWSTAGDGSFDDPSDLAAIYTPGSNDIAIGNVELTLAVDATSPCIGSVADSMLLIIQGSPTVDPGTDQTICETETAVMDGLVTNASALLWTTAGDGSFDDPSDPAAVYTPGVNDIASGSVELTLTVDAVAPCDGSVQDSITLTIIMLPEAPESAASDRNNFCSDDAGKVELTAAGGSGDTLVWFDDVCGGVEIGFGSPLVIPSPELTTTYYARWENDCGVSDCAEVTITVLTVQEIELDVVLDDVYVEITRCIHFELDDCTPVDVLLDFLDHDSDALTPVRAVTTIEVPCGSWTFLCAKDEQHTTWHSTTLTDMETYYVADTVLSMEGGDTDNDGDIDINDFSFFISVYGDTAADGDCPWDGTRDADFDNSGLITTADFTYLSANWLLLTSCGCTLHAIGQDWRDLNDSLVQLAVDVTELSPKEAAAADLNDDGIVDYLDVRIFELDHDLPSTLSDALEAATIGNAPKQLDYDVER